MKIIRNAVRHRESSRLKLTLRMKLLLSLFFATLLQINAGLEGNRSQNITLDLKSATVLDVIREIETTTVYRFLYRSEELDTSRKMDIRAKNQKLERVLQKVFGNSGIAYKIVEDQVVLTPKDSIPFPSNAPKANPVQEQHVVTGIVRDAQGPMPGVSIYIKDSERGTFSDGDGKYRIMASPTDILVFSYVGYRTIERTVGSLTNINVELQEDVTELNEVVLNAGYYKVKQRKLTGSIARVTAEEIQDQPVTNPLMALQGRVAGLEVSPSSGTPGIAQRIRVRGENSLRAFGKVGGPEGGQPLYIIDGLPINSEEISSQLGDVGGSVFNGGHDPLATLNIENIESIEVLKDADATAIYGSRGANGVILITTKKNPSGDGTNFQFSIYNGFGKYAAHAKLLNTEEYLAMRQEAVVNDGIDLESLSAFSKALTYPDLTIWNQNRYTNWQKFFLGGTADITDIQGTLSGGNEFTSYRVGGSFHKEGLITPGDFYFNKVTGNLSVSHFSKDRRFQAAISINYGIGKHKASGGSATEGMRLAPNAPELFNEDGSINWELDSGGVTTFNNPMAGFLSERNSENRNLIASANLGYEVFTGLEAKINMGYTELHVDEESMTPQEARRPNYFTGEQALSYAEFNNTYRRSSIIEPQLSYQKTRNGHSFDALIGASYQEDLSKFFYVTGEDYTSSAFLGSLQGAGSVAVISDTKEEYHYAAIFGRFGYNYKGRYLLNLTGRRDGSSRFGPGKRFGNFGAVGAAWIFSDEKWVREHLSLISFGKLRGSYGVTGNDRIGNYQFYDLYRINSPGYQNLMTLNPFRLFNSDFSWERTRKLEMALEMDFLENRVGFQVNWYRNRSSNQLVNYKLPYTTGFASVNKNFTDALIQNSGWEFLLRGNPIHTNNIQWNIALNLSVNRNKLVSFPGIEDSPYSTLYKVGEPLSVQRVFIWEGVNPETGIHQFQDTNEDGVLNSEDQVLSKALDRDFYGGLSQSLKYKRLGLSFLFRFSRQNARFVPPGNIPGAVVGNVPRLFLDRWQQPGDVTDIQRFTTTAEGRTAQGNFISSDANIVDASFIRLQSVNLSYDFPQSVAGRIGATSLRLFIQGQNLFTITGFKGPDPETGYNIPPVRMITSGLQVNF